MTSDPLPPGAPVETDIELEAAVQYEVVTERQPPDPWNAGVRGTQVLALINSDAPLLRVPSGPGTGKTFGLTRRIVRILHPSGLGLSSNKVLVCTFNRVIANDLREEIKKTLEPYGLESPEVLTVHALCAVMTGEAPRFLLPQEIEAMIYDIRHGHPEMDAQFLNQQVRALRALREHESGIRDHPALGAASREWQTAHRASLVGELPRSVYLGMQGGDYQDLHYDHIIVDEFQDLTSLEIRLLMSLRSPNAQFVALGDRKQSIYAFRGAEEDGMGLLIEDGIPSMDHVMTECQRCPDEIVTLANEVAVGYGEPLVGINGPGGQIFRVHHRSPAAEQRQMAKAIVESLHAHPDKKHLVLTTRRQWGYGLRNEIKIHDPEVSAQTVFSEDILETWPAREAFMFLSIVGRPNDPVAIRDWISYKEPNEEGKEWKASKRNAEVYADLLTQYGPLSLDTVRTIVALGDGALKGTGKSYVYQRMTRLCDLMDQYPRDAAAEEQINWILNPDQWCRWTGPMAALAREDVNRLKVEALGILAERDEEIDLGEIVDDLRMRISTREPLGMEGGPDIKIVTLWGAKGLTADYVYVIGLCDEALPSPHRSDESDLSAEEHEQEQLRLLYVTLTRAKVGLAISRPTAITRGQVPALNLRPAKRGNQFQQTLLQCRFFQDLSIGTLPESTAGEDWLGF